MSLAVGYYTDGTDWSLWCKKVAASPFYYFLFHTQMRYCAADLKKDLSFYITDGKKIIGVCPLFLESFGERNQFSYRGGYLRTPLVDPKLGSKLFKKVFTLMWTTINELAIQHQVVKYKALIDPLELLVSSRSYNWLQEQGFLDESLQTQVIDLCLPLDQLWECTRKSIKSLINKAKNTYEIVVMDYQSANKELFDVYRLLHRKSAGRVTRPIESFNAQFKQIETDCGMLIGIRYQGQWVGCTTFLHSSESVVYESAATDPDIVDLPVPFGHLIHWEAIQYYHSRQFRFYEMGWQQFGPQLYDYPSQKEIQISFFKRALGGKTVPVFRGTKYYDATVLAEDIETQKQRLIAEYKF